MGSKVTKIDGIMYGNFGGTSKRSGSLLITHKKEIAVINKSFKEVLEEVAKTDVTLENFIVKK